MSQFPLPMLLALGVLAACQTAAPPMSLEEAKQVTASFNFTPPPRTITDVMSSLERAIALDRLNSSFIRFSADADPTYVSAEEIGRFYWNRGKAARRIGRFTQAVTDLTRAAEHIKPMSGVRDKAMPWFSDMGQAIQRDLAETLAVSGNHWEAIAQSASPSRSASASLAAACAAWRSAPT